MEKKNKKNKDKNPPLVLKYRHTIKDEEADNRSKGVTDKDYVKLLIDYAGLLGRSQGMLDGILLWEIPDELRVVVEKNLKFLSEIDIDKYSDKV